LERTVRQSKQQIAYSFLLYFPFNKITSNSGRILTAPILYSSLEPSARRIKFKLLSTGGAYYVYLTVSSSFLISFVMGRSGPSRVIKFLNKPEWPEQGD
jgi:hypothetical protein